MSDKTPIAPVTEDNHGTHVLRMRRRRLQKAFLKARDRRHNFEKGEFAGFLYCLGIGAVGVAASGYANHIELGWWQRLLIALLGLITLLGKTYTKRRFWKQTEDAECKEEIQDDH